MVKRYNPVRQHGGCIMVEYEDGEYVRHREHAALAERCERLEALVRAVVSGRSHCFIPTDDPSRPTFNWDERADAALSGSSGGKDGH
jgi:hypothetical protein